MLLKLVMPYIDRMAQRGAIVKWYKTEGEWINYGDDLFDIRIEEVKVLKRSSKPKRILEEEMDSEETYSSDKWSWTMCVTSSDMGVLRRILAKEGASWEIGELLAVLTTDEDEAIDETSQALAEASEFRIVVNTISD